MYTVYILKSQKDGSFYKGYTQNFEERLKAHNRCKVKSTCCRAPWILVYSEQYETLEEALNREKYFKSGAGRRFVKKLDL